MTPTSVRDIRNLTLLGQSGSGKTTLLERLLLAAGAIDAAGSVEKGDTVSDYDPQEKTSGHSLNPSLAHLEWAGHWVNVLDTPGMPDFLGRALATLPAVETAVVVVNAAAGVETVTRKAMDAAAEKCRMIVVNRIDAPGVDFAALDKQPVYSFFLLLSPVSDPERHLAAMNVIFSNLQVDMFRKFLRQSDTKQKIWELLEEVDQSSRV